MDRELEVRRQLHLYLHAVKLCEGCEQMLPIQHFTPPNISDFRGFNLCRWCIRQQETRQERKRASDALRKYWKRNND